MNKIFLAMTALGALSVAAPAAAQYANQTGVDNGFDVRIGHLQTRLQAGVQDGSISRQEAQPLRLRLRALSQLERRYSLNGVSPQERSDLQQRFRALRQEVRLADGGGYDRFDRDDRYGETDRYGRDGRIDNSRDGYADRDGRYDDEDDGSYAQSGRIDSNRDGYDDRDYDRDGRWDDDADDGTYQQPAQRSGIGGVIDTVLGTGGARVGQRAPDNLYGVPSAYRSQYRDSSSAYYRSDGRQIYQIDARNDTVMRVYPMNR